MSQQTLRAFQLRGLAKLPESLLYHVTGPDDYLREEVLLRLKRELLDPDFGDFNFRSVRCASHLKLSLLQDALAELPVMTERRLLELANPGGLSAKGWEYVADTYARSAKSKDVILVLAWEGAAKSKAGAKKKGEIAPPDAQMLEQGVKIVCEVDAKERNPWVQARAQELGLKIDSDALEALLERSGSDLRLLSSHLEKLRLYCGPEESAKKSLVIELVPVSSEVQTWRFTSAIGKKSLAEAYVVLDLLLARGEPAGSLLSYLNTYLVGLAQLLHLRQELKTPAAIAAFLPRKTEYQVKKNLEEATSFSPQDLRGAFDRIERADFRIKTGSDPRMMLQLLVLQLCSRRG